MNKNFIIILLSLFTACNNSETKKMDANTSYELSKFFKASPQAVYLALTDCTVLKKNKGRSKY